MHGGEQSRRAAADGAECAPRARKAAPAHLCDQVPAFKVLRGKQPVAGARQRAQPDLDAAAHGRHALLRRCAAQRLGRRGRRGRRLDMRLRVGRRNGARQLSAWSKARPPPLQGGGMFSSSPAWCDGPYVQPIHRGRAAFARWHLAACGLRSVFAQSVRRGISAMIAPIACLERAPATRSCG